jgi:D-3-phosphoglycerate dehydrogenase
MKFKAVKVDNRYEDIEIEKKILNEVGAELLEFNFTDEEKIIEVTKDADGIITDLSKITEKVIINMKKCKVISKVGIGVDNIDVKTATKKGILVCNVPNYCVNEVSDHTIALILTLVRKIVHASNLVKKGIWGIDSAKPILPLNQMTLGIVGFGSIAQLVYSKAKVFNLNIILYDPYLDKTLIEKYGLQMVTFKDLLINSDIISIHCPANTETKHLFNKEAFLQMKKTAFLINTSRGIIIDNKAMYDALIDGIIAGAAVDVYDPEPILFDDPILGLSNFIITPHYGFYSESSIREVREKSALNVAKVLINEEPINIVNKEISG